MKKRAVQAVFAAMLVSTMTAVPVFATPSVDDLKNNKQAAENEVATLQEQLNQTLNKISALEEDLEKKQEELEKASEDLEEVSNQRAKQYEAMKLRIKYMYESGDTTAIETIMSAENFSDLLNKAEYVQNVHNYDRKKLEEYVATAKKMEKMEVQLQKEAEKMQNTQAELETEKAALNETISSKESQIAQLDADIQEAVAAQQAAARAEEERRQAASQPPQRPAPGNGNSSNSSGNGNNIAPPQGRDGWAVVNYARQFLGYPYEYGGNDLTGGIDCSGFTQQIYARFGVSLGRTTWDQEKAGVEIPFSQAQAGDLIVYEGHVGIFNGAGGLIHASSPTTGIIESKSCTYRPIKTVRRVL